MLAYTSSWSGCKLRKHGFTGSEIFNSQVGFDLLTMGNCGWLGKHPLRLKHWLKFVLVLNSVNRQICFNLGSKLLHFGSKQNLGGQRNNRCIHELWMEWFLCWGGQSCAQRSHSYFIFIFYLILLHYLIYWSLFSKALSSCSWPRVIRN